MLSRLNRHKKCKCTFMISLHNFECIWLRHSSSGYIVPSRWLTNNGQFILTAPCAGIILDMGSANDQQHYNVMASFIGWAHTQIGPCSLTICFFHFQTWSSSRNIHRLETPHDIHTWIIIHPILVTIHRTKKDSFFVYEDSGSTANVHYNDVIMSTMASQITSLTIVFPKVCSGADQRKHQSSASLAFVRGIHRWPVNSPHKGPVMQKMFPFDDVIMSLLAKVLMLFMCHCIKALEMHWPICTIMILADDLAPYWHQGPLLLTWINFNPSMDK